MWPFNRRNAASDGEEQRAITSVPWGPAAGLGRAQVDVERALSLIPVYGCARVLADTIASLPIDVYRRQGDRQEELPTPSLFVQPSIRGTTFDWTHRLVSSLALRGNAYGLITARDYMGYPTTVEWMNPDDVFVADGAASGPGSYMQPVWYVAGRVTPAENIVHIPWFTVPWRVCGLSPIGLFSSTINTGLAAGQYSLDWFDAGGVPSGKFQNTEKIVSKEDADIITSRLTSRIRSRKPLVYGRDWTYEPISITPAEARFVECLVGETPVAMVDGTLSRADEVPAGARIIAWDGEKLASARVSHVTEMPVSSTLRVRTKCGRSLTTSRNHQYLAARRPRSAGKRYSGTLDSNADWLRADELRVGDYVRVALSWDTPSSDEIDSETAWALGALVGNGHLPKSGHLSYSGGEQPILDRLQGWLDRYEAKLTRIVPGRDDFRINAGGTGRREGSVLKQELAKFGLLGRNAPDKRVPSVVMRGGPKAWAAFLSGYFDADGFIVAETRPAPIAYWGSVSKRLLDESQHLLAMLGVKASVRLHQEAGTYRIMGYDSTIHDQWTLTSCGRGNVARLAGLLDLTHARKASRLAVWGSRGPQDCGVGSDVRWTQIKSIEDAGRQVTYGLTVDGHRTHVTAGIVTHNTARLTATQIATIYGVDPTMVGGEVGGSFTYSNTEQLGIKQLIYTFGPWIARLEAALSALFPRPQFVKFNVDALLRTDATTRWGVYKTAIDTGIMDVNEVRALEDLPPKKIAPPVPPVPPAGAVPPPPPGETPAPAQAPPKPVAAAQDGNGSGSGKKQVAVARHHLMPPPAWAMPD